MKIEHFKVEGPCTIKMMNELGVEGWELVFQRADNFHSLVTYFKREKIEKVRVVLPEPTTEAITPKIEPVIIAPLPKIELNIPDKKDLEKALSKAPNVNRKYDKRNKYKK